MHAAVQQPINQWTTAHHTSSAANTAVIRHHMHCQIHTNCLVHTLAHVATPQTTHSHTPTIRMTSSPTPSLRLMLRHPAYVLGLGFGSGLAPKAPGTAGTLLAWLLFVLAQYASLAPGMLYALGLFGIPVGWWACTRTAGHLSASDPGCIVWDEIAAFWLVLCALHSLHAPPLWTWAHVLWQAIAFVLFRFFDAAKPQPVRWADRAFKGTGWRGGWGIMWDDLIAAACTVAILALITRLV